MCRYIIIISFSTDICGWMGLVLTNISLPSEQVIARGCHPTTTLNHIARFNYRPFTIIYILVSIVSTDAHMVLLQYHKAETLLA